MRHGWRVVAVNLRVVATLGLALVLAFPSTALAHGAAGNR
jgi:hypothetical protein